MQDSEAQIPERAYAHDTTHPAPVPARVARILTHSAMEAWGRCETEYRIAYEELIAPVVYPSALAIGSGFHAAAEAVHLGRPLDDALCVAGEKIESFAARAREGIDDTGRQAIDDAVRWDRARVGAMLRAWFERHLVVWNGDAARRDRDLEIVETEMIVEAPLVNPTTGRRSRSFTLSGRIDAIVRHREDGYRFSNADGTEGWHVYELKTTGEDLGEFVEVMSFSAQPAIYQTLAESHFGGELGSCLGTVVDVIRKPSIRPKKDETPEAFEARAIDEYAKEPDRFLRRVVLPVNESLRRDALVNAWRIADGIRRAERYGYVTKRGPSCRGAYGPCRYRSLCWTGDRAGYAKKETAHEELAP